MKTYLWRFTFYDSEGNEQHVIVASSLTRDHFDLLLAKHEEEFGWNPVETLVEGILTEDEFDQLMGGPLAHTVEFDDLWVHHSDEVEDETYDGEPDSQGNRIEYYCWESDEYLPMVDLLFKLCQYQDLTCTYTLSADFTYLVEVPSAE